MSESYGTIDAIQSSLEKKKLIRNISSGEKKINTKLHVL